MDWWMSLITIGVVTCIIFLIRCLLIAVLQLERKVRLYLGILPAGLILLSLIIGQSQPGLAVYGIVFSTLTICVLCSSTKWRIIGYSILGLLALLLITIVAMILGFVSFGFVLGSIGMAFGMLGGVLWTLFSELGILWSIIFVLAVVAFTTWMIVGNEKFRDICIAVGIFILIVAIAIGIIVGIIYGLIALFGFLIAEGPNLVKAGYNLLIDIGIPETAIIIGVAILILFVVGKLMWSVDGFGGGGGGFSGGGSSSSNNNSKYPDSFRVDSVRFDKWSDGDYRNSDTGQHIVKQRDGTWRRDDGVEFHKNYDGSYSGSDGTEIGQTYGGFYKKW